MQSFNRSIALIVGINAYGSGVPPLRTARADAERLAALLRDEHGYEITLLVDEQASKAEVVRLMGESQQRVGPDDRLLIYFAGHGIALDGDDGPAGYLLPQDARPEQPDSFLPMRDLHQTLAVLPCRHLLLILDCCFAGAFRWSATRAVLTAPALIHRERFERYVSDPAWQVLTSAAHDQEALDVLTRFGTRGDEQGHSPFARALFDALGGAADLLIRDQEGRAQGDGVITATELYLYLRDCVERSAGERQQRQTPGLWALNRHGKGEFIFLKPGAELKLPPAPALSLENNPYRGLKPFDEEHKDLFFGRATLVEALRLLATFQPLTVVTGSSGSGKSSLVKAGLLPQLREDETQPWAILPPLRPGARPRETLDAVLAGEAGQPLAERVGRWREQHPGQRLLLLLDQFEELVTLCRDDQQREQFLQQLAAALDAHGAQLRMLITVRSDFEPQFSGSALREHWARARFVIPQMSQDDLRQAIEGPAAARVLYFEPPGLVDRIINEVVQMPGALPLLSFTLSELYIKYLERRDDTRALAEGDYEQLGGVAGALRNRANQEYELLDAPRQSTMRQVMLRMVSLEGGGAARRRVLRAELDYADPAENERVESVIRRLSEARLLIEGREEQGEAYVEPAHDALVRAWDRLWEWIRASYERLPLQRRLNEAARDWAQGDKAEAFLWDDDPRLQQVEQAQRPGEQWLNRQEGAFVQASSALRRRKRRKRAISYALALIFAAITVVTSLVQRDRAIEGQESARAAEATAASESDARATEVVIRRRAEGTAEASAFEAERQRATAVAERERAEQQTRLARSRELAAQAAARLDAELDLGLLLSMEALEVEQTYEARNTLYQGLERDAPLTALLREHRQSVGVVAFSPDGTLLASGDNGAMIIIWDVARQSKRATLSYGDDRLIMSLAWSPDGRVLAAGDDRGVITLWSLARAGMLLQRDIELIADVSALAWSPSGQLLASGHDDGRIRLWESAGLGAVEPGLDGHTDEVNDLAFSPDGSRLASASDDATLLIWDVASRRSIGEPLQRQDDVNAVAWSPDGTLLASGDDNDMVTLWDLTSGEPRAQPLPGHGDDVRDLAFSFDSAVLASGGLDSKIILWDSQRALMMGEPLGGHSSYIFALSFSPVGPLLASGGFDEAVGLWDISRGRRLSRVLYQHDAPIRGVVFSPADGTLISASCLDLTRSFGCAEEELRLWDIASGQALATLPAAHHKHITNLAISRDGRLLASGDEFGQVVLWDLAGRRQLGAPLEGHTRAITSLTFSPDGATLASGGDDKRIILWDVASGRPRTELEGQHDSDIQLAFSPDGETLASAGWDGQVKLWHMAAQPPTAELLADLNNVLTELKYSPDGKLLAIAVGGGWDEIRLWDVAARKQLGEALSEHEGDILELAFSPDGRLLATAGVDERVILWDVASRQPFVAPLQLHRDQIAALAFSPDGRTLATGGEDRALLLWDVWLDSWRAQACALTGRNLERFEWEEYFAGQPYRETCR